MGQTFNDFVLKNITDAEVAGLIERIRPLYVENEQAFWVKLDAPSHDYFFREAFLWDVDSNGEVAGKREELARFQSYHTFGAPVYFKPSLAECAAQIRTFLDTLKQIDTYFKPMPDISINSKAGVPVERVLEANAFEVLAPDSNNYIAELTKDGEIVADRDRSRATRLDRIAESLHKATIVLYKVTP